MTDGRGEQGSGPGLRILPSNSVKIRDCLFRDNIAGGIDSEGGGVYARDSNLWIVDSVFEANHAFEGGGIRVRDQHSSLTVDGCRIESNVATIGGGISVANNSRAELINATVRVNTATDGSIVHLGDLAGGGLFGYASRFRIDRCVFTENTSKFDGAGLHVLGDSTVDISETRVEGNQRFDGGISNLAGADLLP